MKEEFVSEVLQQMLPFLDNSGMKKLREVLEHTLFYYELSESDVEQEDNSDVLIEAFLSAKRIEGCSEKTIKYYRATILTMMRSVDKGLRRITTEDLRGYLIEYQRRKNLSRVTVDNVRRILSSLLLMLRMKRRKKRSFARHCYCIRLCRCVLLLQMRALGLRRHSSSQCACLSFVFLILAARKRFLYPK